MTIWLLWGSFWAIIGMMTLGGAAVPFALLASGFKGMWSVFFIIIDVLVVTWGARIIGMMIAENGVNHKLKQTRWL